MRVKIAVPGCGLGNLVVEIADWLSERIDRNDYAQHADSGASGHAIAFYFRDVETALAFVRAFPQAELADGTRSRGYTRQGQAVS